MQIFQFFALHTTVHHLLMPLNIFLFCQKNQKWKYETYPIYVFNNQFTYIEQII